MNKAYKFATLVLLLVTAAYFFNHGWMVAGGWIVFGALLSMLSMGTSNTSDNDKWK